MRRTLLRRSPRTAPRRSFAGLYETYLNVRGEQDILTACTSATSRSGRSAPSAIGPRNGGGHDESMAVVVMGLVPSETSGIAFTAHPVTGALDTVVINSSWGLGEAIVSGRVTPDSFLVTKGTWQIVEREIYPKEHRDRIPMATAPSMRR